MAASETLRERADCLTSCRAMPVKLAINGACGRMGRRLLALACKDPDIDLVQAIEYPEHPSMVRQSPRALCRVCDRQSASYTRGLAGQARA